MIIKKIQIENFRNLTDVAVQTAPALVLTGHNGHGKSSLCEAVRMALLGRCEGTGADGRGSESLIRDGADEATITVTTDTVTATCTLRRRGKKREWCYLYTTSGEVVADTPADYWRVAGVPLDHVAVALMPDAYLLSPELGQALADLVAGRITPDDVLAHCGRYAEAVRSSLKPVMGGEYLTRLGEGWFADRTEKNRELKTLRTRLEEFGQVTQPTDREGNLLDASHVPAITERLARLRQRRDALLAESGRAETMLTNAQREALTAEAAALNCARLATERQEALVALREAERLELLERTNADAARAQADQIASRFEALVGSEGQTCPTCGLSLPPEVQAQIEESFAAQVRDAGVLVAESSQRLAEATVAATTARAAHEAARVAHDAALARDREIQAALSACESARPVDVIARELEDATANIQRGEALLAKLATYTEHAAITERIEELTFEMERLNWAVENFRDGAIAKKLMSSGRCEFTARVNAVLGHYGYEFDVAVDGKTVTPLLSGQPLRLRSRGEQLLTAWALGSVFGAGRVPVILDNINDLDAPNRRKLLASLRGSTLSVICAGAWQQSSTDLTAIREALAPVTVAWMQAGSVTVEPLACAEVS